MRRARSSAAIVVSGVPSSSTVPCDGTQQAGHAAEQRRFAGAVRAEHGSDVAGCELHADGVENAAPAALERQLCDAQPGIDLHVTCLRIEYSSAKKNGAPISDITTPSCTSEPPGKQSHDDVAREHQRRAADCARHEQRRWLRADERSQQVRHDEADEADDARHRHAGRRRPGRCRRPVAIARGRDRCRASVRRSSPSVSASSARREAQNQYRADDDERRGDEQIVETAIGERAEQPAHDLAGGPRARRQREHQRDAGRRRAR